MINQTHIVIDLETMGKGPNAPIAAIGAVAVRDAKPIAEFYRRIDLESAMIPHWKREADASTIQWWLQQSAEARAEIDGSQPNSNIIPALEELAGWMAIYASDLDAIVWGNGSSFDNVILRSAYSELSRPIPWQFRNDHDLRTILAIYPEAKDVGEFDGTKHHALHDARHEAKQLCQALRLHAALSAPPMQPTAVMDAASFTLSFLQATGEHDQLCDVFDLDDDGRHKECTCGLSLVYSKLRGLLSQEATDA